jgi:hypothetical protein
MPYSKTMDIQTTDELCEDRCSVFPLLLVKLGRKFTHTVSHYSTVLNTAFEKSEDHRQRNKPEISGGKTRFKGDISRSYHGNG